VLAGADVLLDTAAPVVCASRAKSRRGWRVLRIGSGSVGLLRGAVAPARYLSPRRCLTSPCLSLFRWVHCMRVESWTQAVLEALWTKVEVSTNMDTRVHYIRR